MKLFTVKDFITYNNPCFNCQNAINMYLNKVPTSIELSDVNSYNISPSDLSLNKIQFHLNRSYYNSNVLNIEFKTNRFHTNNVEMLKRDLINHGYYLSSQCSTCGCLIQSNKIEFDFDLLRIKPLSIDKEFLTCNLHHDNLYIVTTETDSSVTYQNSATTEQAHNSITKFSMQPYYLFKFKNKEQLIKKAKTYLLYS